MGQLSLIQGIFNFVLHCIAVTGALASVELLRGLHPRWKTGLVVAASFAAAFVLHVVAFIVLKQILGEGMIPEIHRPIVGMVWATTSGLVCWLMLKRNPMAFWSTAFLTICAYFVFVLLRPLLP